MQTQANPSSELSSDSDPFRQQQLDRIRQYLEYAEPDPYPLQEYIVNRSGRNLSLQERKPSMKCQIGGIANITSTSELLTEMQGYQRLLHYYLDYQSRILQALNQIEITDLEAYELLLKLKVQIEPNIKMVLRTIKAIESRITEIDNIKTNPETQKEM